MIVDIVDGQDGVEHFSDGVVPVVEYALVETGKERPSGRCEEMKGRADGDNNAPSMPANAHIRTCTKL